MFGDHFAALQRFTTSLQTTAEEFDTILKAAYQKSYL